MCNQSSLHKRENQPSFTMSSNTAMQDPSFPGTIATTSENQQSVLVICAVQPKLRTDSQTLAESVENAIELIRTAHRGSNVDEKIDLFVLPELSPIGYCEHTFTHYLPDTPTKQQLYKDLDARMAKTAKQLNAHICYGTIGWHSKQTQQNEETDTEKQNSCEEDISYDFTIQQKVVEPSNGLQVAVYDKIYLCDYGDCAETRFFVPSPSQKLVSFTIGTFSLGLMICADQRVPTLARTLAAAPEHNVDILLQPAAFVRDVSFATWKSFRETRAVENSCYFLGVNYCGSNYGETTLVPPWVDDSGNADSTAQSLGCDESWLICKIQRSVLQHVRTIFPFYRVLTSERDTLYEL